MSSSFSRPQTRRVNALFDPGQPGRAQGMDRVAITRTSDGRFRDYGSAEIAGANAERGFTEVANFINNAVEAGAPVYKAYLQNEIDKELGEVASTPEAFDSYLKGDEESRAWISRFRPQTQYYVNQQAAQAGAVGYKQRLAGLAIANPVRRQAGSSEEELLIARSADREKAIDESGLRNLPPEFLGQVSPELLATDRALEARMSTLRDRDAKEAQDSGIAAGLGSELYTAQTLDFNANERLFESEEARAKGTQDYKASKTQYWQARVQELEKTRTSVESGELIWRAIDETSAAAFGAGSNKDMQAGLEVLDQGWYLVNNNDIKTSNGQVLGQVVITQDGKTLRQVVAERRRQLQPLADKAEVDAAVASVAPRFKELMKVSPSTAIKYLFDNLRNAQGEIGDLSLLSDVFRTVGPLLAQGRLPSNEQLLQQAEFEVRLRSADSKAETLGILDEAFKSGLTPAQIAELSGLSNNRNNETDRLANAERKTKEDIDYYSTTLATDSGVSKEETVVELRRRAEEKQAAKVQEFVAENNGTPPDTDKYQEFYGESLKEAFVEMGEARSPTGEKPQTKNEFLAEELNSVEQNMSSLIEEGKGYKSVDIFSDRLRGLAVSSGYRDDYNGVQRFLVKSLNNAKDSKGQAEFPNAQDQWFKLTQRVQKGVNEQGKPNQVFPRRDPEGTQFIPGSKGIPTRKSSTKTDDKQAANPVEFVGQALAAIVGGRPAQAGTLEGKPGVENPDALDQLAAVVSGRQDVSLRTPSLPQTAPDTPAEVVPAQISTDTHPFFLAIGIAEGTRTPDGGYTQAYYGHSDPGNGVRNVGTVSSQQYGNPDVADRVWAGRLSALATRMTPVLFQMGVKPGTVAFNRLMFNRLDLEVQSPAAAADLFRNLTGDYSIEGIAKARADSFINPATGQLEAGGFGGSYNRLFTDQRSRAGAYDYKARF